MKIVHHIDFTAGYSGLDIYAYSMHVAGLKIGQERYVCHTNTPVNLKFLFHEAVYDTITREQAEKLDNAVHIIHRHLPPNFKNLKNTVFFAHGTPIYITERDETIEAVSEFLQLCDMTLTSWQSHIPYWKAIIPDKPVIFNRPGVDLDYFRVEGPKWMGYGQPDVLWADSWRGDKQPWHLLYAFKTLVKDFPDIRLKMLAIPEKKQPLVALMSKSLGIEDRVIFGELEPDVRPFYRGADILYSAGGEDGNNVQWEALACGLPVVATKGDIGEIAEGIRTLAKSNYRVAEQTREYLDIKHTCREQEQIFREVFKVD